MLTMWHPLSANVALTSPTIGGGSVGIVRSRTQAKVFFFLVFYASRMIHKLSEMKIRMSGGAVPLLRSIVSEMNE
jgi:hypothetical protein